jgi:hypothetical protein
MKNVHSRGLGWRISKTFRNGSGWVVFNLKLEMMLMEVVIFINLSRKPISQ